MGELVTYCDKPFPYSFFKDKLEQGLDLLLYKRTKYSFEEEFRFATARIGSNSERLKEFNPTSVSEVVLGPAIPEDFEKEILNAVRIQYLNPPIYKTRLTKDGSLIKYEISY